MLSLFTRKAQPSTQKDQQINRVDIQDGEGVIYASKNAKRGIAFSFSGPAGSRHAEQAMAIAGQVYSNEPKHGDKPKRADRTDVGKLQKEDEDSDEDERKPLPKPVSSKRHSNREHTTSEAADSRRRHVLTPEDARSVFSNAPTTSSRATTSASRHTAAASRGSDVVSVASTQVSSNRHNRASAQPWKSETDTQVTYGVKDGGRQLFVSAPKDSREGGLLQEVAEKATRGGGKGYLDC